MVKEFSKPQEARQLEARARARTLGVRVAVVVEASRYASHPPDPPRPAPAVRWPTVQSLVLGGIAAQLIPALWPPVAGTSIVRPRGKSLCPRPEYPTQQ